MNSFTGTFRILIVIYITLKVTGNVLYGASYWTDCEKRVMGILMYWLGMYLSSGIKQSEELPDLKAEFCTRPDRNDGLCISGLSFVLTLPAFSSIS